MVWGHVKTRNVQTTTLAMLLSYFVLVFETPDFHTGMQLASASQVEAEPFLMVSCITSSRRSKSNTAESTWPFTLNKNEMEVHMTSYH